MAAPRRQSERREQARGAMLNAAIELLASGGYSGMTLADVGRAAGYSHGLAPFYFESKAGLVRAIQVEIDATFTGYMAERCAGATNGRQRASRWLTGLLSFSDDFPQHFRASMVLVIESVISVPELAADHNGFARRNVSTLRDALEQGLSDGSIGADVDARTAAVVLSAMVKGLSVEHFSDSRTKPAVMQRAVLDTFERLVPAQPAAKRRRTASVSNGPTSLSRRAKA